MSAFIEITDRHGRRRRARPGEVMKDGERIFLPPQFMDAAAVLAEKYGPHAVTDHRPQGFVRGYALADSSLRDEAAKAYEEKRARLDSSRRHAENISDDAPLRAQDAAQARALADQAWSDKKQRLQNSWRNRT
jgi:hypothetical protein